MFHLIKIFWNSKCFFYRLNEHAKGLELHMGAEKYLYYINELDFKTKHSIQNYRKVRGQTKRKSMENYKTYQGSIYILVLNRNIASNSLNYSMIKNTFIISN